MRFELFSQPSGSLRVIREIPDFAMCQIEGKNGIGKTLAARLLEFLTGGYPFSALPHAWSSLAENLGQLEVRVSGLSNDATMLFRVDSASWVGRAHATCVQDPGGRVELNGREISWAEARRLLKVRRIAGDEGLPETLGRTLREHAIEAEAGQSYVADVLQAWSRAMVPTVLARLASPEELKGLREALRTLRRDADSLSEEANRCRDGETRLARAIEAVAALQYLGEQAEPVVRAYSDAYAEHRRAADAVAALEAEAPYRAQLMQAHEERRSALASWERKLELRQRAVVRAEIDEQQAIRGLGLHHWPDMAERRELESAATRELAEQRARAQTMDNAGTLRQLTQQLEHPLQYVPATLLTERVVAGRPSLTGAELRTGLRQRREELRNVPEPEELVGAKRTIAKLERRLQILASLGGLREVTDRKRRNLEEATDAILAILEQPGNKGGGYAQYRQDLDRERAELQRAALVAAQRLAAVLAVAGAQSGGAEHSGEGSGDDDAQEASKDEALIPPEEARRKISEQEATLLADLAEALSPTHIARLGIDLAKPHGLSSSRAAMEMELRDMRMKREEIDRRLDAVGSQVELSSSQLESRRVDLRFHLDAMTGRDDSWLPWRSGMEQICQMYGTSLEVLAETLLASDWGSAENDEVASSEDVLAGVFRLASQIAESMLESGARVRDGWSTVAVFLNRETSLLAPRLAVSMSGDVPRSQLVSNLLRDWAEGVLSDLLSTPELIGELFDGAAAVRVDLQEQSVEWRTSSGQRVRRPLEAFSSGEQVFAYTRAKLEQLRSLKEDGGDVVVILDEFGAFVARERFGRLLTFVEHDALGRIADQVVVMLPLRVKESELSDVAEAGSTVSPRGQVLDRGYVASDVGVRL